MQLKRFVYDWESGRSLKFDQHFQFPLTLDMTPYTEEGIARQGRGKATQPIGRDIARQCCMVLDTGRLCRLRLRIYGNKPVVTPTDRGQLHGPPWSPLELPSHTWLSLCLQQIHLIVISRISNL